MPVTISGSGAATFPSVTSNSQIFNGSSSGTTTVQASATASGTITLPAGTGTVAVNGVSSNIVSGSVNAGGTSPFPATGGPTVVTYSGLPSWIKRITVSFNNVASSGASNWILQLGYGSTPTWVTSGYSGCVQYGSSVTGLTYSNNAAGIYVITNNGTGTAANASVPITLLDASTNTWACSSTMADTWAGNAYMSYFGWSVPLSGTLTAIRLTTVNGTDTFKGGKVNILYE